MDTVATTVDRVDAILSPVSRAFTPEGIQAQWIHIRQPLLFPLFSFQGLNILFFTFEIPFYFDPITCSSLSLLSFLLFELYF